MNKVSELYQSVFMKVCYMLERLPYDFSCLYMHFVYPGIWRELPKMWSKYSVLKDGKRSVRLQYSRRKRNPWDATAASLIYSKDSVELLSRSADLIKYIFDKTDKTIFIYIYNTEMNLRLHSMCNTTSLYLWNFRKGKLEAEQKILRDFQREDISAFIRNS